MRLPVQREKVGFVILYFALAILFAHNWFDVPQNYCLNYAVLFFAYIVVGGVTFYYYASGRVKMFDPFSIISILYFSINAFNSFFDSSTLFCGSVG